MRAECSKPTVKALNMWSNKVFHDQAFSSCDNFFRTITAVFWTKNSPCKYAFETSLSMQFNVSQNQPQKSIFCRRHITNDFIAPEGLTNLFARPIRHAKSRGTKIKCAFDRLTTGNIAFCSQLPIQDLLFSLLRYFHRKFLQ